MMQMQSTTFDLFGPLEQTIDVGDDRIFCQQPARISLDVAVGADPLDLQTMLSFPLELPAMHIDPFDSPGDELCAFVHHINREAPTTTCESPTLIITANLHTPASKRVKPPTKRMMKSPAKRAIERDTEAAAAVEPRHKNEPPPLDVGNWLDLGAATGSPQPSSCASTTNDEANSPLSPEPELDAAAARRKARAERNCASAALSRKRKREHEKALEALVATLREESARLTADNAALRLENAALARAEAPDA